MDEPTLMAVGPFGEVWEPRYHVPRSQVWEGSRGASVGHVHVAHTARSAVRLVAVTGRAGAIVRQPGVPLCGKPPGWYERPPAGDETRCPKCVSFARRYGIAWL